MSYRMIPAGVRTFGQILDARRKTRYEGSTIGTCRFCKRCDVPGLTYAMRSSVCDECCEKRRDETLPVVLDRERKARRLAQTSHNRRSGADVKYDVKFIASLSGASIEYVRSLLTERS